MTNSRLEKLVTRLYEIKEEKKQLKEEEANIIYELWDELPNLKNGSTLTIKSYTKTIQDRS